MGFLPVAPLLCHSLMFSAFCFALAFRRELPTGGALRWSAEAGDEAFIVIQQPSQVSQVQCVAIVVTRKEWTLIANGGGESRPLRGTGSAGLVRRNAKSVCLVE